MNPPAAVDARKAGHTATPAKVPSSPERGATSITKGVLRREYVIGQRLIESDLTRQLRSGNTETSPRLPHRFLKAGLRLARKASMPSFLSSVPNSEWNKRRS